MSLNGLDDPAIVESYQTALAEAGGWFLLKYVDRDVLALLGRGTGGVAEIRVSIDGYGETSPLYGFLQYRRRKVVLRYVPAGISRLVQARITVQFQSFLDKFSPHDTVLSLSLSTELTESALSSACSLHTASGSMTSSSSSLRRRRLVEITEDAEENGAVKDEPHTLAVERDTDALSQRSDVTAVPTRRESTRDTDTRSTRTDSTSRPSRDFTVPVETKQLPEIPKPRDENPHDSIARHKHFLEELSQPSAEPRRSSQSTRPSLRDLDVASLHRPKVKLGPRPSADNSGRPRTAGSLVRKQEPRPVATMPAGIRSSASQRGNSSRPKSQPSSLAPPLSSSRNVPPVPSFSLSNTYSPSIPRPPLSPSVKSFMTTPEPGVTPEKQRLMRALQLRQKRAEEAKKKTKVKEPKAEVEEVHSVEDKENTETKTEDNTQKPVEESPHRETEAHKEQEATQEATQTPAESTAIKTLSPDPSKPDSAVDIVITEADTAAKAVDSTSTTTTTPEASTSAQEPSKDPLGTDNSVPNTPAEDRPQEKAPEQTQTRNEESHATEQHQIAPELDTGRQDSEQDSSSFTEIGSSPDPSHETSVSTIDLPEDMESTDSTKVEGDAASEEVEVTAENDGNMVDTAEITPVVETKSELVQSGEKEVEPEEALPSKTEETSDAQNTAIVSEAPTDGEPETDAPAPIKTDEVSSDITQSNIDSTDSTETQEPATAQTENTVSRPESTSSDSRAVSDEPSGNSSSTVVDKDESERKNKRRALVDPIQIVPDHNESDDDNLLSDDSFMDELTSATVQEAKPVSVSKSPMASSFSEDRLAREAWGSRAVSNPNLNNNFAPDLQALPVGRSASGSYFDRSQDVPVLVAKKVNVSSGISKRIKALEMFSSREPSPGPTPAPPAPSATPAPSSSAFEKFRKRSSVSQSHLPVGLGLMSGSKPISPSPSESTVSKAPTPSRKDSVSAASVARGKSNSVSVTARIIRDPAPSQSESPSDPSEPSVLNLQCSPLIVERETTQEDEPALALPPASTTARSDNRSLSVSSSTGSRRNSFASILPRSDSTASRLSGSSRPKMDRALSDSNSNLPSSPLDSVDEGKEEKKESRKSRIIRRMSSITSNSRRGLINSLSPTVTEEEAPPAANDDDVTPEPPQVIDIGEVNVQFPDTLLWKRRFMRIDDQGFLILTPGNTDATIRNIVKRYHLSEFRTPCLPDHDRQELPNSIVLDFCDGSTLQCACESRQGQSDLLQTLVEAHGAYH